MSVCFSRVSLHFGCIFSKWREDFVPFSGRERAFLAWGTFLCRLEILRLLGLDYFWLYFDVQDLGSFASVAELGLLGPSRVRQW